MTKDEIISYWLSSSEIDFKAMESLLENGHYVWALFTGHLVLEKLLKAWYVINVDNNVPYIHDLLKIAEKASLEVSDDQKIFLDVMTSCNIKARYPDYKNKFYKKATREFTANNISKVKEFKAWILKKIEK